MEMRDFESQSDPSKCFFLEEVESKVERLRTIARSRVACVVTRIPNSSHILKVETDFANTHKNVPMTSGQATSKTRISTTQRLRSRRPKHGNSHHFTHHIISAHAKIHTRLAAAGTASRRITSLLTTSSILLAILLSINLIVIQDNFATTAQSYGSQPPVSTQSDSHGRSGSHPRHKHAAEPEANLQSQQSTASTSTGANAACFGGLQTFEKISMSSFENPAGSSAGSSSNGGSFGSGILVQQDDQALTSECINLCRSQSNCLSFVIDYNKFECKSYATTQQELQQEFASRFQSARATSNETNSSSGSTDSSGEQLNGYQASASSSALNFQQLLPSASSNYFEKICLDGVANRNQFSDVCGQGRLWTIERVVDSFLDGFVEKEVTNVNGKDECSKLCIFETQFVCRSADYDHHSRLCRLSKEDRRTQPQAMRYVANSNRQYLENQCATPGPSSCVYETKRNVGIISMDALKFAQTAQDCQMKCNQESTFNCRSYSFHQQRCFLSGDDSVSLNSNLIRLPQKQGWLFGEKKCLVELCTKGIFSYERITGYTLRSALPTSIDLMMPGSSSFIKSVRTSGGNQTMESMQLEPSQTRVRRLMPPTFGGHSHFEQNNNLNSTNSLASAMMAMMMSSEPTLDHSDTSNHQMLDDPLMEAAASSRNTRTAASSSNLAITEHCRHSCDLGYLNCPAFTIDYKNNRCQRLDRNSQGRHHELVARDGFAYYEKICLRVPEIMSMCQDKYWIFERVIGYELAPRLYDKSLKFVQSRRDCEEYCLEEKQFQCRSALYNDETSDCKLSRYDRRLALQEGGYYRNFNVRVSYLENNCVRDRQLESKQCYYEQTKEEPSYPTYTEQIEMASVSMNAPSENSAEGSPSHPVRMQQNNQTSASSRYGSSFCEQLCNDNSKFECHSFGYYASTAQCFLSGDDSVSAGESATTPSTGFVYYEKKCRLGMNDSSSDPTPNDQGSSQGGYSSTATPMSSTDGAPAANANPYFQPSMPHHHDQGTLTHSRPMTVPMDNRYGGNGGQYSNSGASNATQGYQDSSTAMRSPATTDGTNPDMYKCGAGHSFVYQRISGFEPIGGYLTLLLKNNEQPGIVAECSELCKRAFECRAFVVDYNSNQCFAMLENSSVGLLNLRQTLGKDYFEGFCVADYLLQTSVNTNCRNRTWIVDKIVDQAVFGVQHQKLIPNSDRVQCRRACLEERLFVCKSAMYDSSTADCKLYSIDRESIPQMRLIFTKGVDFFENQCQITSSSCPYDAIERDMTIITVTRSVQARSTFDCEQACNSETSFNCRSYTYLDLYPSLPNMCFLSSDSRSTSQRGSVQKQQRTLYAERNCYYRRPRFPGGSGLAASHKYNFNPSQPMLTGLGAYTPGPPINPMSSMSSDPYRSSYGSSSTPLPPDAPMPPQPPEAPSRVSTEQEGPVGPAVNAYDVIGPPLAGQSCEPHQFTFERTFGYDFKLAPKERAPIAPTIGIAIGCQQECLRRGDKCQSFVVDYALPYQSCFLMENQVGANKKLLVRSANSAYFEKVCLPRTGLSTVEPTVEPIYSHAPMMASASHHGNPLMDPSQSLDISPSYSQEPWSLQTSQSQLPYYLQQQNLAQNYPSRACAKLWTFERFVNHNFTAPVDKMVENSLTRAQCETQCLNEASFTCRAATYDYTNKLCRLYKSTRRTMTSHFVDLDSSNSALSTTNLAGSSSQGVSTMTPVLANSHPGTAHVLDTSEPIQTSASSIEGNDLANRRQGGARQLQMAATAEPSSMSKNIDYLENTCTPEPSSCQYRQIYDQFSPYIDKVNHASSLGDCQRQCDQERLFSCKSINFDAASKNCMLVNEDLISLARGQQTSPLPLLPKRNTIYSEKGNCEMISVQCNSQEMLVAINFDAPFRGRIMAKGNPEQCYVLGDGQTSLQFSIVFGPKCNSRQEGHNTFVNEVVIQQHPVIMTESDKTVRVMCAFETPDQTITLKNPSSRDNKTAGIDVGTPESSRTRHDKQQFNSIVSNKAPPPSVVLRILDQNGRDASMINLGDDLMLKIQMQMTDGKGSALGIFARNLAARSSNGESLLLIDNEGCPVDPLVFPALEVDQKDARSLYSNFKAFRFPSSGLVNFEVQIRFCPERCQPVDCKRAGQRLRSFGRRRRKRQAADENSYESRSSTTINMARAPILQSVNAAATPPIMALDSLSTVMKPGKAFEYVRKLMLPQPEDQLPSSEGELGSTGPTSGSTLGTLPENQQDLVQGQEFNGPADENKLLPDKQESNFSSSQPIEEFDNHSQKQDNALQSGGTSEPAAPAAVDQQLTTTSQFSQPDLSQSNNRDQGDHFTPSNLSSGQMLPGSEDQIAPPVRTMYTRDNHAQHPKPIQAPYGEFQTSQIINQQVPTLNVNPTGSSEDPQSSLSHQQQHQHQQQDEPFKDQSTNNDDRDPPMSPQQNVDQGAYDERPNHQQTATNSKDLPLRFSILVAENQVPPPTGQMANDQPPTIMNSTSMDIDHIVIPGKKGQFEDGDMSINSLATSSTTNNYNSQDNTGQVSNGNGRLREPNKRNASYEQTFDALPSSSVSSQIHISHDRGNAQGLSGNGMQSRKRNTLQQQPELETTSESAASHDCQAELAGKSKLRAIIWTGGIVIGINVCLVLLSLILYFRKVHLRKNHTIVRSSSDCGTAHSDGLGIHGGASSRFGSSTSQWPSVILKSKNKLGTSIKTHEQFFCKLNAKPSSDPRLEQEFNWPNISTSSSRSTLSSLAGPLPSSSIRINQMRPSLKSSPFDAHSSLRNGNFIPDHETQKGIDESDIDGEYPARYTNNIDILRSERF